MGLKVVAKRKEGFTAPIAVALPWNPPGIGSAGGVVDPREAERGGHPDQRRRRRRAEDLADRGQRLVDRAERADHRLVAAGQADRRRAVRELHVPGRERRAGEGDRPGRQGGQGGRLRGRGAGHADRPAEQGDDRRQDDHQGHDGPGLPPQDRHGLSGGQPHNLFCQVVITQNGEPIVHNLGTGALRIDVPLPPKPNAPPARAVPRPPRRPRRRAREAADPAGEAPAREPGARQGGIRRRRDAAAK